MDTNLRTFTITGGSGEVWTIGENLTSDAGYVTGYIYSTDGEMMARRVFHLDNISPV